MSNDLFSQEIGSEVKTSGCGEDKMEHLDDLTDVVPPTPYDSPLLGGHTPRSDEGGPNLLELMNTCTQFSKRVLALEEAQTNQAKVITILKLRVRRLEKKRKAMTSQPMKRRLFKGRVETSIDKSLEDKGSGEKSGSTADQVSTARPEVSVATPSTPPTTTTTIFGSTTTLQPLPTIDLKDKGKGVLVEEEPEKLEKVKGRDQGVRQSIKGQKQEEDTIVVLTEVFDEIQARIDVDHELAKQLAAERAKAIRNKPHTRTQVRNKMITYLKHIEPENKGKKGKRIKRVGNSTLRHKSSMKQKMMQELEYAKSDEEESADYEHEKEELRIQQPGLQLKGKYFTKKKTCPHNGKLIFLRLSNQEFDEPPSDEEIVSFFKELIGSVTKIKNRDSGAKRNENMSYPRFTKSVIQQFISKEKSIFIRNRMFMHTVRDDSALGTLKFVAKSKDNQVYEALNPTVMINKKTQKSNSYKSYIEFRTGATTPKKDRKWKKLASPSKKQTHVITEEPAKKPAARRQSTSIQIRDTPGVSVSKKKAPTKVKRNKGIDLLSEAALLKEAQMKKAIERSKQETHMHQEGGSSDGAGLEPEIASNEEETQENTFIHTPDDYIPTDDETRDVDDEEYDCINEEMYDDVHMELKDVDPADEGKGDEEMTDVEKVIGELEEVNQEEVKILINVDHNSAIHAAIKFEVSIVVKECLGTNLEDSLHKKIIVDIRKIKMEQPEMKALLLDQTKKRRKMSKDVEPSKNVKSTDTSKGTTKCQPKSTGKSTQVEDILFKARDTQLSYNLGEDMGKTDELPIVTADPKDWFKVSKHDVYSMKRILEVTNVKVNKWYGYGHFEEIEVRRVDQQLYKFVEGDFLRLHLNEIKDMLLLVVQNKLFNLNSDVIVNLAAELHMFTRLILNGDSPVPTRVVVGVIQLVAPTTAEQRLARKNELKAHGNLLMALPDKHKLKFNSHKDAKTLMEVIEKRFGGNTKTKKEDVNLKFLRSLPSEWRTDTLIWRTRRFLQRTGRNLEANGPTSLGFDMSKVECYNCHKKEHFARECRSPTDTRRNGTAEPQRRSVPVKTTTSNALVSQCDGYDWNFQAEEVPTNYALMAFSSSNSFLIMRQTLEKAEQERDDLKIKLQKFQTSKNLTKLLASQTNAKTGLGYNSQVFTRAMFDCDDYLSSESDESLPPSPIYDRYQSRNGYHVVPPPYTGTFMPPKPDLVFNNASNAIETNHTAFTLKLSPTKPDQDLSHTIRPLAPIIEDWVSDAEDESETKTSQIDPSFVQPSEQVKSPRPSIQHAETSIPPKIASPKPTSNGKSKNRKACFVCKILTQSKLVPITAVTPVSTAVPKISVTRPRHVKLVVTKPNSPKRRLITLSPSPKANNSPPRVIVVKAPVVNAAQGMQGKWEWKQKCLILDHGNPQHALKDKGVIDSGCSRHMTRNMSYLSYFKELNGGYVVFRGNPKGGKIFGKGKIQTGKLDFDDVYFVKEIKFNLFSVSQMCDKKNSVLFTDTECLVLSPEFKLPDESQVLLRVPRENNMYNVNLKNIVPSGDLTCLFAKATIDESNLWHTRLSHINFKTINKLVKGNLVRGLPTKVFEKNNIYVACKKGKQHKASCKTKPAEAVNTSCYVQNRVLVTKPHNKTPYKLLHCRTLSNGSMRPFGYLVTILNTIDSLGKFDGKVDEGFLVGYSVSSKAFRVFNSSGPTWLFDIDTLTKTMNYQPVTACNQSNPSACFQDIFDEEKTVEESDQQYVLFPVWSCGSTNPHNTDGDANFNGKEPEFDEKKPESEVNVSPSSSAESKKQDDKTKREAKGKSHVESFTGYRDLSAEFEDFSNNSINEVNDAGTLVPNIGQISPNTTNTFSVVGPSNAAASATREKSSCIDASQLPDDPDMPEVKDITYFDDADNVGTDAGFNNLETSITAMLSGTDNRPPMLEKDMYDSWKSRMELYMLNRQHGKMILESVEHGPLLWPTFEDDGVTRLKKYSKLSIAEAIQADCDVKATNIIPQALPLEIYALFRAGMQTL
nr:ribonuclease H-like domain-containing protein [Tanacetum cinerariifolium]